MLKLIVLGSGTCVPSLTRNAPGYYMEAEDYQLLVDCGSGTLLQLERAGKSYRDIDAVFITHRHPDHFADLMPLIHALLATPKFKREKDLFIFGPTEFITYYDKSIATVLGKPKDFTIQSHTIDDRLEFGPFNVFTEKTLHSASSIAYRLECGGKTVVFTGDAAYDQGLIEISIAADLLVADCSFPDADKVKGHLSAKECGIVAKKAGVKKMLLSHLYPADTPDTERVNESREAFDGEVILAEDLMEIDI
ncbi:MAG: MBL fold metallo-hydrolase [Nitrospirota bacterium]